MESSVASLALLMAFAIDLVLGELPNRWHPVAWMGQGIAWFSRAAPRPGRLLPLAAGLLLVAGGGGLCAWLGWQLESLTSGEPWLVAAGLQAVVLKQTFSIKALARAAGAVEAAMRAGDLSAARQQLAFHLVSRETMELSESQIAAATIESVAENASDSVVAPLFFFAIGGLPAALAYRFINTCDAMVGYRTEEFQWFGKAAARIDDLANLIPARLTALLILVAGGAASAKPLGGVAVWFRDRYATASPNAGQPMSAAAGVLGVELEKVDCYSLGSGQRPPTVEDIGRAVRLLWLTSALATLAAAVLLLCRGRW